VCAAAPARDVENYFGPEERTIPRDSPPLSAATRAESVARHYTPDSDPPAIFGVSHAKNR